MEKKTGSPLKARWSFILVLILVIAAIAIAEVLYSFYWLFHEDLGIIAPTRYYADQVGTALILELAEQRNAPEEIYRWRHQGQWDGEPQFSEAALFWFTYNSDEEQLDIRHIHDEASYSSFELERLSDNVVTMIDSVLSVKQAGGFSKHIENDDGDFLLQAHLYPDEPRVVGALTDMEMYRRVVLPSVLEEALTNYPSLQLFTQELKRGEPAQSSLFIIYRDGEGRVVAHLGEPGDYVVGREKNPNDYVKTYAAFKNFGMQQEIVVPECYDIRWEKAIRLGYYGLISLFLIVILLWIRAEIRLGKAQN